MPRVSLNSPSTSACPNVTSCCCALRETMQEREECLWCTRTTSVEIGLNAMRWPPCVPTHTASGLDTIFVTAAWEWETPEIPKMALQGNGGREVVVITSVYVLPNSHSLWVTLIFTVSLLMDGVSLIFAFSLKYSHVTDGILKSLQWPYWTWPKISLYWGC